MNHAELIGGTRRVRSNGDGVRVARDEMTTAALRREQCAHGIITGLMNGRMAGAEGPLPGCRFLPLRGFFRACRFFATSYPYDSGIIRVLACITEISSYYS